jgi:hypothetical protein
MRTFRDRSPPRTDDLQRSAKRANARTTAKISGVASHANEARLAFGADSHRKERAGRKGASPKDDLKTKSKSMIAPTRTVMCEEMEK